MPIDLSRFKVVYSDRVLQALALENVTYKPGGAPWELIEVKPASTTAKPVFLTILCINEDGNIVALCDEAWRFQFVPIIHKGA